MTPHVPVMFLLSSNMFSSFSPHTPIKVLLVFSSCFHYASITFPIMLMPCFLPVPFKLLFILPSYSLEVSLNRHLPVPHMFSSNDTLIFPSSRPLYVPINNPIHFPGDPFLSSYLYHTTMILSLSSVILPDCLCYLCILLIKFS